MACQSESDDGVRVSLAHGHLIYDSNHASTLRLILIMSSSNVVLTTARYGKDKVRVFRVKRESDRVHHIVEYNVTLLVEGDIDVSWVTRRDLVISQIVEGYMFLDTPRRTTRSSLRPIPVRCDRTIVTRTLTDSSTVKNITYCTSLVLVLVLVGWFVELTRRRSGQGVGPRFRARALCTAPRDACAVEIRALEESAHYG